MLNLLEQQKIRIGTCAWTFPAWRGSFFPAELPQSEWLWFYAQYLKSVEIDSTFYATPPEQTVLHWAEATPANFRFACKLPKQITHVCRLHDCQQELKQFLDVLEPLSSKLGPILIQLPPSFAPEDGRAALRNFLPQLPPTFRFAIEFRHPGWHRPQIIRLLEKYRVCWTWADTSPLNERNLAPFEFLPVTADFLYLRLLGDYTTKYDRDGHHRHEYGKLLWKREAALESWATKIDRHREEMRNIWIFVNNHFEGFAPSTAQRIGERLGYELTLPTLAEMATASPGQLDLFQDAASS